MANPSLSGNARPCSRRATAGLELLVLFSLLGACERGTKEPPVNEGAVSQVPVWGADGKVYEMGEQAEAPHYTMRLTGVKECELEPYFEPQSGHIILGVEVALEGRADTRVPANPFYATLVSGSGETYPSTLAGCRPGLTATQLSAGESALGFISFVVPATAADFKLHYRPVLIGFGPEELRFDIGR